MLDRLTIERLTTLAHGGPIVVALSGGGDSSALLHLLADRLGAPRLRAAIVDHALREGSAADAKAAAQRAQAAGVVTEISTLHWPAAANRSQRSARERRYTALCAVARAHGARVIALGHTADDQAETVFMRAAAGSSWRGLSGMAALASAPLWPEGRGIAVARPLLSARREELRAFLRDRRLDWIEDPANANPGYERVRVRERLRMLSDAGFDPMRLAHLAARLRAIADATDAAAGVLIASAASFEADRITVARDAWSAGREIRRRALSALIDAAAGAAREAPAHAVARLDARMHAADFRGATLAGVRIAASRQSFVFERDRGALEGRAGGAAPLAPLRLIAGIETVWDGRLALTPRDGDFVAHAAMPEPRLVAGAGERHGGGVAKRWLLAERAAHALNQQSKQD
ncbi:MAG: tRNA lysidine(34) synthetase TilS [Proteobacteria bacterium]|nr:tRNA lysidine(34) synthetase TilS [Pseudomonadota bacterium]